MTKRAKKKSTASPLAKVISTIEKQATGPAGVSLFKYLGPKAWPLIAPVLLGFVSVTGWTPWSKSGGGASLPEITQVIRPGGKSEIVPNDPNRPNPFQLTAGQKPPGTGGTTPQQPTQPNPATPPSAAGGQDIVFAFWNCENFFDDKDDKRNTAGDKEYDSWFAHDPSALRLKLEKLTEAILSINGGRGPDIFACCEVESTRAIQLLQAALNAKLTDPRLHYTSLVMQEVRVGRHIAPAVLTRLPVNASKTQLPDSRKRILKCHVMAGNKELIVVVGHWTSRLQGGEKQRMEYAESIYGLVNAIYISNPKADVIICGDFNDNPTDVSVTKGLHATANPNEAFASSGGLKLLDLFGTWTPNSNTGSLFYQGWNQFDHILISPGMLDAQGWSCDPSSVRVVNHLTRPGDRNGRPWRFGGEKDTGPRGYSDHFPVAVRLIARP